MNDVSSNATLPPNNPISHDYTMAETFLHGLDPNTQLFTFLLVAETGHPKQNEIQRHCTLAEIWPTIIKCNQPNNRYAVYVTINETDLRGRKTENIIRVRGLWVDADTPESTAKIITLSKQVKVKPSMLVASKRDKAHAYWLTNDTKLEEFRHLQEALIELHNSDGRVHDLPRVMRLPGTLHLKGEPQLVKMWAAEQIPTYNTQQIIDAFKLDNVTSKPKLKGFQTPSSILNNEANYEDLGAGIAGGWFSKLNDDDKNEALRQMLLVLPHIAHGPRGPATKKNPPEWLDILMAVHASGASLAEDVAREWSKLSDKYSEPDFDKAWNSFTPAGRITVATLIWIAGEHGFNTAAWRAYVDELQNPTLGVTPNNIPPVGGAILQSALPPQKLWDTPGNKRLIMDALDRRLAADPYTFMSDNRLISLRVPPDPAALFSQFTDQDKSGSTVPAIKDE